MISYTRHINCPKYGVPYLTDRCFNIESAKNEPDWCNLTLPFIYKCKSRT